MLARPLCPYFRRPSVLLASLLILVSLGCASRPAHVCMKGDLTANGTIKTVIGNDNNAPRVRARALPGQPHCLPKIALIDVDGLLVNRNLSGSGSMGENPVAFFREKLDAAAADADICAIVLRINSPGGGVTASDIMRRDLVRFRQQTSKPVVACLMDLGTGGAYYLASATDLIVAHPTTLTGGLGVIFNQYDITESMSAQSVYAKPVRAGSKIDIGSPSREFPGVEDTQMARAERYAKEDVAILKNIAATYHTRLQSAVVEARPNLIVDLPEMVSPPTSDGGGEAAEDADARATNFEPLPFDGTLFDGRVFVASEAQRYGLIDQLGYLDDALATARDLAGLAASKTVVFRRNNDRALTAYDITPNLPTPIVSVPLSIPGLDRSQLPAFLYLWQPDPLIERTGGL